MIYTFHILNQDDEKFVRVIEIDEEDTFMSFHTAIQEAVNFDKSQLASFYLLNENWEKEKEVTIMDMSMDDDEESLIMDQVKINELVKTEDNDLVYVFDFMSDRSFICVLEEIQKGKEDVNYPVCSHSEGDAPEQISADDEDISAMLGINVKDLEKEFDDLTEKGTASKYDDLYDDYDDEYDDLESNRFDNIDDFRDKV